MSVPVIGPIQLKRAATIAAGNVDLSVNIRSLNYALSYLNCLYGRRYMRESI